MKIKYLLFGIACVTSLAYWNVTKHDFVNYDDDVNVYENPYFHPVNLSNTLHFWKNTYEHLYIPVTYTVWALQAKLSNVLSSTAKRTRFNPHIFHTANLLIHVLNTLLVFVILRLLVRDHWGACAGALLFALHPVQVETVAWVTGLKGLLCGFFSLLAVWSFVAYSARSFQSAQDKRKKRYLQILTHLSFLLGILANPSGTVTPVLLLIMGCLMFGKGIRQSSKELLLLVLLLLPVALITVWSQPKIYMSYVSPLVERPLILGDTVSFYFSKLIYPYELAPDYGRTPQTAMQSSWIYFTGIVPFFILAIILWRYRRPWILTSIGIFLASILPVSGIIPFGFQNISTTADRYVYLAMLGPCLALAWILSKYRSKVLLVTFVSVLFLLALRTAAQTEYWQNSKTLFRHVLSVNSNSWSAHNNLGLVFLREQAYGRAFGHFQEALKLKNDYESTHLNLGVLAVRNKDYAGAIKHYSKAAELNPLDAKPHNNLANVYQEIGRFDQAIEHYNKALSLAPNLAAPIYNNIGSLREVQGNISEAIRYYRRALAIDPGLIQARMGLRRSMLLKERKIGARNG